MGVIEQVSRFDPEVGASRYERHMRYLAEMARSIRSLQRHGQVDQRLDPTLTASIVGAMTYRFPEMWFVQGLVDCIFEDGVEQLTLLFVRALGLRGRRASCRRRPLRLSHRLGARPAPTSSLSAPGARRGRARPCPRSARGAWPAPAH